MGNHPANIQQTTKKDYNILACLTHPHFGYNYQRISYSIQFKHADLCSINLNNQNFKKMDRSLESRIQLLEDIEAIKKLQATYGHFVDQGWNSKQFQDVSHFFTEEATFECAAFGINAKGNKQISESLKLAGVFAIAQHSFTNPIIDVDGDNATGKWLLWVGVNGGESNIVFESEDVKYVRTSEGWKIQAIELSVAQMLKNQQL